MTTTPPKPVTQLLNAVGQGDQAAAEQLWVLIYDELRGLAKRQMADEGGPRTLQPTALVHEVYLRLMGGSGDGQWANRRHFFAVAAKTMRHIRINDARKRRRLKRGGGQRPGALTEEPGIFDQDPTEVLAVHEALDQLEEAEPRQAEVVMLRYFAGLSIDECAEALELSPRTVDSDWRYARAWLHRELSKGDTAIGTAHDADR